MKVAQILLFAAIISPDGLGPDSLNGRNHNRNSGLVNAVKSLNKKHQQPQYSEQSLLSQTREGVSLFKRSASDLFQSITQMGQSQLPSNSQVTLNKKKEEESKNLILNNMISQYGPNQINVQPVSSEQMQQQDKCFLFTTQFKEAFKEVETAENARKAREVSGAPATNQQDESKETMTLPHLFLSSIEFCFDTQTDEDLPYDLKIVQCVIAMHQYMQIQIFKIRQEELTKGGQKTILENQSMATMSGAKFEKEFCKELTESLNQVADIIYDDTNTQTIENLKSYPWMPSFAEDVKLNQIQNDIMLEGAEETENPCLKDNMSSEACQEEQAVKPLTLLGQAMQISLKAWIRLLIYIIKSDCSKRTGDINIPYFVQNCQEIMYQQAYLPIADSSEIEQICASVQKNFQSDDNCDTVSKEIVQIYLKQDIEKQLMYIMQFSTSDSFIEVLNEQFIDMGWDLTKFDMSNTDGVGLAQQQYQESRLTRISQQGASVQASVPGSKVQSQLMTKPKVQLTQSASETQIIEQQQAYIQLLQNQMAQQQQMAQTLVQQELQQEMALKVMQPTEQGVPMTDDHVPTVAVSQTHQKKSKIERKKKQSHPETDMYVDVDFPPEEYNSQQPIVIEGGDATLELTQDQLDRVAQYMQESSQEEAENVKVSNKQKRILQKSK